MPRRHLDEFLARHHIRLEAAKAYALLALMIVCGSFVGYIAGRIDSREDHRSEIERLQSATAVVSQIQAERIKELTIEVSELTRRTTEAAVTSTEAARAATTAATTATTAAEAATSAMPAPKDTKR